MKERKMSLKTIQGKLSREEMKQIKAGSGCACNSSFNCTVLACGNDCYGYVNGVGKCRSIA